MPKASGDSMAASADPEFISPLAVPANFPAMSIGIDHIGPMIISAKKNAAPSANVMTVIFVREEDRQHADERREERHHREVAPRSS